MRLAGPLTIAILALVVLLGVGRAADPGSRQDPLATVSYVTRLASFARLELSAGDSLTLGPGAELVVVESPAEQVPVRGMAPECGLLVDLSAGTLVRDGMLQPYHDYVNGAAQELWLKVDLPVSVLVRGEWR